MTCAMRRRRKAVVDKGSLGAVNPSRATRADRGVWLAAVALMALALSGCASRAWNQPLAAPSPQDVYDFRTRLPHNAQDTFVVLAFSGGGTRAAAFSYGVLEKLRDTRVVVDGRRRRLLDEVDVITAVSGGSYTAAYYGLFGERIFTDFARGFLCEDWQGRLLGLLANPLHWLWIAAPDYNRSDLVAGDLNRSLFKRKTFTDMSRDNLPFVIINASDLNNATTFSFIQSQFDFLCSDLSSYPVADAVMASSAVPGTFAPMALRNFKGCAQRHKAWVRDSLAHDDILDRRYAVARALERYSDPARMPILRLVDGGVTDNLGVRGSMMSPVAQNGDVPDMAGAFTSEQLRQVRHVLVIVVNAQVYHPYSWALHGREPGLVATTLASFDAALGLLNTETVSLAQRGFMMWARHVNALRAPGQPKVKVDFAVITFNQIHDPGERARFEAMPTTFRLKPAAVDALRAEAGNLLDQSPEFQSFRRDLAESPTARR